MVEAKLVTDTRSLSAKQVESMTRDKANGLGDGRGGGGGGGAGVSTFQSYDHLSKQTGVKASMLA